MKVEKVDYDRSRLLVSFDFWEIESMGYDILKQKDVNGMFYDNIISVIEPVVIKYFDESFKYGIKTIIDQNEGRFYYEVMPYEERLDEFILSEWSKNGKRWILYDGELL